MLRWHRLAFSIKGDSINFIYECNNTITKPLKRSSEKLITDGITLIGFELTEEKYFNVKNPKSSDIYTSIFFRVIFNF